MDAQLMAEAREVSFLTDWRIEMTIPSILGEGEQFSLRMTLFGPDALPCAGFDKPIEFEDSPGIAGLPKSVSFSKDSGGMLTIDGLRALRPGAAVAKASVRGFRTEAPVRSNPAWIYKEPPFRIFWGDIHVHTYFSNCNQWSCLDPEFCYQYARDASHLDVCAAADHLRGIAEKAEHWPRLVELVKQYHEPGRFVPLLAFESSHKKGYGGDNNAYFGCDDAPYFWLDRDDMRGNSPAVHLRELWKFLDETGKPYMTVPHHTGRATKNRTFDEDYYDAKREPLFEIYSSWGSSEIEHSRFPISMGNSTEAAYYVDAIKAGCRYGVIGSSDDHATKPGSQHRHRGKPLMFKMLQGHPFKGLTAFRAHDLSRDSIWQAMQERNVYASTHFRTLVDVQIGDASMGQEVQLDSGDPLRKKRVIAVMITNAWVEPLRVTLVRNGEDIETRNVGAGDMDGRIAELDFIDESDIESIALRNSRFHPEPFVAYYLRIESHCGQTQWTSPVWLNL